MRVLRVDAMIVVWGDQKQAVIRQPVLRTVEHTHAATVAVQYDLVIIVPVSRVARVSRFFADMDVRTKKLVPFKPEYILHLFYRLKSRLLPCYCFRLHLM